VNLASSVSVTGNITANYYYGNGSQLTGLPFSTITNQTVTGNGVAGNFALAQSATSDSVFVTINGVSQTPAVDYTVLGNVITFTTIPIVGDVAQIRFLAGNVLDVNYSNANVAAFLPTYSGNVSANYFIGNGSQLTGIAGGTGNTGNITFNNTTITSNVANANVTVQANGTGNVNLASSVSVTGNITADYLYGNGYYLTGLLTTITNQTLTGNSVATTFVLNRDATADGILVTVNGISQTPTVDYTVSGNALTFTSAPVTGDTMQVRFLANNLVSGSSASISNGTSNVTVVSSGGNVTVGVGGTSNIAVFATTGQQVTGIMSVSGNITGGNLLAGSGIISTAGNITGGNLLAGSGVISTTGTVYGSNIVAEAIFDVKSANFNAVAGSRYGVDTTGGAVTATLPVGPSTGQAIFFADAGGAYSSNNLIINPNGATIMGAGGNMTVSTNNQSVGLFYNGSTWRTYNAG